MTAAFDGLLAVLARSQPHSWSGLARPQPGGSVPRGAIARWVFAPGPPRACGTLPRVNLPRCVVPAVGRGRWARLRASLCDPPDVVGWRPAWSRASACSAERSWPKVPATRSGGCRAAPKPGLGLADLRLRLAGHDLASQPDGWTGPGAADGTRAAPWQAPARSTGDVRSLRSTSPPRRGRNGAGSAP